VSRPVAGSAENAAEGNAPGEIRGVAEHRPGHDDDALDAELAALRELIPGADIWVVRHYGGYVSWQLTLRAGSGQHLLEYVRDAGKGAEAGL
jgi:hypothetical protein